MLAIQNADAYMSVGSGDCRIDVCRICRLSLPYPCFLIDCRSHVRTNVFTVAVLSFLWVPFYGGVVSK